MPLTLPEPPAKSFILTKENDRLQKPDLAFYRVMARPGEVYHAWHKTWKADTDQSYLDWLTRPQAEAQVHATENDLSTYLEQVAPGREPGPSTETARVQAIVTDPDRVDLLDKLKAATPAQIKTYVNTNVTDLASAKVLLTKIVLLLALLARS